MNHDYDVLIVGGGLVGGSLALALRGTPLRVGVVEAQTADERRNATAGNRALALARGTAQALDRLGAWSRMKEAAMPIRHIHVSDRGHFGKTRLHAADQGLAALGYVVRARTLETAIEDAMADLPAGRLCPARVIGLQAGSDAVDVTLKQHDECLHARARLLVAADGGNSTVRTLLGIDQAVREYRQTAIVTEVQTARDTAFTAYERFTAGGPLAFLPLESHRSSVVWTLRDEQAAELMAESEGEFIGHLQAAFGQWLGRIEPAGARVAFPLKLIQAEAMAQQRVVLIGNAMHQIHPVAGQGFNLGLRDSIALAERLGIEAACGGDIGDAAWLAAYVAARRRDLGRVIRFTDSLVRVFSNESPPLALARNLAMVALDCLPPAKRLLARHAMGYGERL